MQLIGSARNTSIRADIQGLRGVAVLCVVIYHSEVGLPGGFVGVDIFFVISGFVITSSVIRQIEHEGRVDFLRFYRSRVTRLLPGFVLVLLPTLLVSFLFFDPYVEYPEIASAAVSGLFFSANLFFATIDTYDDLGENPLRHLWSLGVEEHFYVLFPVFLYVLYRGFIGDYQRKLRRLRYALTLLILTSLTLSLTSHYLASTIVNLLGRPELEQYAFERGRRLSFFFSPFRAWEILVGCLIATAGLRSGIGGRKTRALLKLLGVSALFVCVIAFKDAAQFPGLLAGVPVTAAAALIAFAPGSCLERFLSVSPLVHLGNISYSLYLWHWPIMVIVRRAVDDIQINVPVSITLSYVLASISTSHFENKFRSGEWTLKALGPLLLLIPLVLGLTIMLPQTDRFQKLIPKSESKINTFAAAHHCEASPIGWETSCVFGDKDSIFSVYLMGDSNARSASDGLAHAASTNGWSLTISALSACPLNFSSVQTSESCAIVNNQRLALLRSKPPSVVVIVNHWTDYADYTPYGTVEQQLASLTAVISTLQELAIPSIIQYQVPICEFRNQLIDFRIKEGRLVKNSECSAGKRESAMRLTMGELVYKLRDHCNAAPCEVLDLSPILCNAICRPFRDGTSIFADDSHISSSASRLTSVLYQSVLSTVLQASKHS